jgi:hypothetical protein
VLSGLSVALLLIVVLVIVLGAGAAGDEAPASGAAALVPADALAYGHVSLDGSRPAVKQALAVLRRFPDAPLLQAAVLNRLGSLAAASPSAGAVDFATDIRPWLGAEAALALLDTSTSTAGSLIVLDVSDRTRARQFLERFGAGTSTSYRSTGITAYARGTEVAFVGHYLVIGQDPAVRASIDVAAGRAPSLQSASAYRHAAAGEPAGRVLDLYASAAGVRRLLAPQGGVIGALGGLLYKPTLTGVSIALTPRPGGLAIRVHSALDASTPAAGASAFSPALPSSLPAGTTLMLDLTNLDGVAPRLLGATATGGVGNGLLPLLSRIGIALGAEGVNVHRDIVSAFHGETVVALVPGPSGARPTLLIVARAPDEQRTRAAMAALQTPFAQLFGPRGPGVAPVFTDHQVGGITVHQLTPTRGLELDYAVFDQKLVIATSLGAIAALRTHAHALTGEPAYRAALATGPDRVTSVLFLDFSQLLSLGEQTGLTRSAQYQALRPDLEKVRAVGLSSTSGETDSTAELFLQIP